MMDNSGNAPALNVILCIQGLESDISLNVPAIFLHWVILLTFGSFMVVWRLGSWNGLLGLEGLRGLLGSLNTNTHNITHIIEDSVI